LDDYSKDEIQQDISMGKDICDTPINVQPSKKKIPHRNPVRNISGNTKNLFQSTDRISSAPIQRDVDRAVQKTQKEESGTLLGDFTTPTTNLEEKVTELRAEFTLNVKEGTIHDCVVTNENLFSHEVEKEAATLNKCLKGKILYPKNAENQRMMTLEMEPVIAEAYIDNQEGVIRFYGVKPLNFDIYIKASIETYLKETIFYVKDNEKTQKKQTMVIPEKIDRTPSQTTHSTTKDDISITATITFNQETNSVAFVGILNGFDVLDHTLKDYLMKTTFYAKNDGETHKNQEKDLELEDITSLLPQITPSFLEDNIVQKL
jgi:hypothetical protein